MPRVTANGVDLYYEAHGDGEAILGIHGTPSSALLWVDAAGELASRGRCIIYDRRGFGRSQRVDPDDSLRLIDHVDDATGLLGALSAIPAVVIGRSTGGLIALDLARRVPDLVRALVLLEAAVVTLDPEATAWADGLRRKVLHAASGNPASAAEVVVREALGDGAWESFPAELQELFADGSPAVLAEIRGRGLDLSEDPLVLSDEDLGGDRSANPARVREGLTRHPGPGQRSPGRCSAECREGAGHRRSSHRSRAPIGPGVHRPDPRLGRRRRPLR